MPKKRKSSGGAPPGACELDPKDAKINLINTWEDIPDEEDTFHISRDKVMLSDENFGKRRADEYGDVSDEEVLALDYDSGSSSTEEEDHDDGEGEGEEKVQKGSKRKTQTSDSDDDDDRSELENGDTESWGTSKKDYYGGDIIETEQDAALEEAEALRLQAKQLAAMNEADFMFDEDDWKADEKEKDKPPVARVGKALVVTEELPTVIPESMSTAERMKILKARHPEFEPLVEEFAELQPLHAPLSLSAEAADAVGETVKSSVAIVKFRALSAYLGVLSMYFAVLSSPDVVHTQGMKIREHGVIEGLVKCREMWNAVKDLEVEEISSKGVERKRKAEANGNGGKTLAAAPSKKEKVDKKPKDTKEPKRKRAKLLPAVPDSKSSKKTPPILDLSDLTTLVTSFRSTKPKPVKEAPTVTSNLDTGDFGDDVELTSFEAEQKASHRRSLRFYTSQIVSKSAKRDLAGQNAGGDTDIPYRERRKEKQLRLAAEAARHRNSGADLDDEDPNEEDKRVANEMREAESDNEYYDMIASKTKLKKAEKKAYHDAEKVGGKVRVIEEENDGKRAIGYVIEKNKGLTPHRKKDVRNPRVKKRKKYEQAKKKLGSKKTLYKGGLKGAYGGEMTGIKKNLVKSVKFA